jgi:hypothetical protein
VEMMQNAALDGLCIITTEQSHNMRCVYFDPTQIHSLAESDLSQVKAADSSFLSHLDESDICFDRLLE